MSLSLSSPSPSPSRSPLTSPLSSPVGKKRSLPISLHPSPLQFPPTKKLFKSALSSSSPSSETDSDSDSSAPEKSRQKRSSGDFLSRSSTHSLRSPQSPPANSPPSLSPERQRPPSYFPLKKCIYVDRKRRENIDDQLVCSCVYVPNTDGCLGNCLNRLLWTECTPSLCPCGTFCRNQRFQKHEHKVITEFLTPDKGWGIKSLEKIHKGDFVIEYVGEIISTETAMKRLSQDRTRKHFYILNLDGSELIDASFKGNKARFINHSCDPNCETQKWMVRGEWRVGIFAIKDLEVGDEITFDYNFQRVGKEKQPCHCKATNCRGFLGEKKKKTPTTAAKEEDTDDETQEGQTRVTDKGMIRKIARYGSGLLKDRHQPLNDEALLVRRQKLFLLRNRLSTLRFLFLKRKSENVS